MTRRLNRMIANKPYNSLILRVSLYTLTTSSGSLNTWNISRGPGLAGLTWLLHGFWEITFGRSETIVRIVKEDAYLIHRPRFLWEQWNCARASDSVNKSDFRLTTNQLSSPFKERGRHTQNTHRQFASNKKGGAWEKRDMSQKHFCRGFETFLLTTMDKMRQDDVSIEDGESLSDKFKKAESIVSGLVDGTGLTGKEKVC